MTQVPNPESQPGPQHQGLSPGITPQFVQEVLHLEDPLSTKGYAPPPSRPFTFVTIDSRRVKPGALFVALKGERFDGHDFIDQAVEQGAAGVIHRRGFTPGKKKDVHLYAVESTLLAYRKLAAAWRREMPLPVVAVAGSAGKTTTKELIAAALGGKFKHVLKTMGNLNGFIGVAMTLLELRPENDAAVIEVGIDEEGAMKDHMEILHPTAAVLSAVGPEHLEKLRDVATVAREEGQALTLTAQIGGFVAVNLDDPWIRPHFSTLYKGRAQTPPKKLGYGLGPQHPGPDTLQGRLSPDGSSIAVTGAGLTDENFQLPLLGRHNAANLLAAIAVARGLGLSPDEMRQGLANFKGAEGRSEVRDLPGPSPVVCDYYNAQPASVEAGLELLVQVSRRGGLAGSRWACLGDMLELGPDEERYHRELASPIARLSVEHILLYGTRMKWLEDELRKTGFGGEVAHFDKQWALVDHLMAGARPRDAILIKGSRSMKMEEVWKQLETRALQSWK